MKSKLLKTCSIVTLTTGLLFTQANAADENIDVTQHNVTNEELAAIFVLSEICPTLNQSGEKFDRGYTQLVKEYLPNEKNPVSALESLAKQDNFKAALDEARSDAKKASDANNTEICQDVSNFNS